MVKEKVAENATLFPMGDALRNYTPIVFVTVVIIWFLYKDVMKCYTLVYILMKNYRSESICMPKINKAYMMLGIIKRNFKYLTIPTFVLLYNSMVRSHLDYCSSVWAPYKKEI